MTRHTAAQARQQFFELLDAAERGEEVLLERRGVRFRIVAEPQPVTAFPGAPLLVADDAVLAGEWSWDRDDRGALTFVPERRRALPKGRRKSRR